MCKSRDLISWGPPCILHGKCALPVSLAHSSKSSEARPQKTFATAVFVVKERERTSIGHISHYSVMTQSFVIETWHLQSGMQGWQCVKYGTKKEIKWEREIHGGIVGEQEKERNVGCHDN